MRSAGPLGSTVREAVEAALGVAVVGSVPVGGGCICDGWEVELSDATRVFVKTCTQPPALFFTTEAAGLDWLRAGLDHADGQGIDVPHVLAVSDGTGEARGTLTPDVHPSDPGGQRTRRDAFLVLEWVEEGNHTPAGEAELGRGLAALHRFGAPGFGWDRPGHIGTLPQTNGPADGWARFYADQRLAPLVRLAADAGSLGDNERRNLDRIIDRIDGLVGPPEPPARLHGDLWGGNAMVGIDGHRWLIDPAPYGGSRQVDLAMMHLFGGFAPEVFAAYDEAWPPPDGIAARDDRRGLHQLYPLLVHAVIFGGSYGRQVGQVASRYA